MKNQNNKIVENMQSSKFYLDTFKHLSEIANKFGVDEKLIDKTNLILKFTYFGKQVIFRLPEDPFIPNIALFVEGKYQRSYGIKDDGFVIDFSDAVHKILINKKVSLLTKILNLLDHKF